MSDFSDNMSFYQRTMNFLGAAIFIPYFMSLQDRQTEIFRKVHQQFLCVIILQ